MCPKDITLLFPLFSLLAIYLLWVLMYQNGTIDEMDIAVRQKQFADGTPLQTVYCGISLVDYAISTLVAFTYYLSDGSKPSTRLLMVDVVSTLQAASLWCLIDSLRLGRRSSLLALPAVWGLLWNGFGAAVILPLYIYTHLHNHPRNYEIPLVHAKTLPFTMVAALILPAIMLLLPPFVSRFPSCHQAIIAIFQTIPIWATVLQHVFSAGLASVTTGVEPQEPNADLPAVRRSYLYASVLCATAHLYVLNDFRTTGSTLAQIYIPSSSDEVKAISVEVVARGAVLFLKYDFILINVCALLWSYLLIKKVKDVNGLGLIAGLVVANTITGPGATLSAIFWWREPRVRLSGRKTE